jgi:hypothetical protein
MSLRSFAILALLIAAPICLAQGRPGPGWPDLLPARTNYSIRYEKPIVGPGEKPVVYQQKATYDWNGGRIDQLEVTFLRDPAVKEKYSAEAMKKDKHGPSGLMIDKKQTWRWIYVPEDKSPITSRLVVVLSDDKAILLEQKYHPLDLQEFAKKLDFSKIEKALEQPPR